MSEPPASEADDLGDADAAPAQVTAASVGEQAAADPLPPSALPVTDSPATVPRVREPVAAGSPGKVRSPAGGWLLALVTLGIYYLFWYYNVNKELRDFDPSIRVSPGIAVLALFVPIVNLVSIYNTGGRIRQAQTAAGAVPAASGLAGMLLAFVIGLDLPYYNAQANHAWRAVAAR